MTPSMAGMSSPFNGTTDPTDEGTAGEAFPADDLLHDSKGLRVAGAGLLAPLHFGELEHSAAVDEEVDPGVDECGAL